MKTIPLAPVHLNFVLPLVEKYIAEACPDMTPSIWNAYVVVNGCGINGISRVAVVRSKLVGFTLLRSLEGVELTKKTLHSMGTYVLPEFRKQGIGEQLRREAMEAAKRQGYECIQGFARSKENAEMIIKLGGEITGFLVETML